MKICEKPYMLLVCKLVHFIFEKLKFNTSFDFLERKTYFTINRQESAHFN